MEALQLTQQLRCLDFEGLGLDASVPGRVEQLADLGERADRKDLDSLDNRGLGSIGGRQNQVGNPLGARRDCDRQHARHGAQAAIQAELADQQKLTQVLELQCTVSAENADRDGQIEARAFLLNVRRSEVDGDVRRRNRKAGVLDCRPHPVATLAHRRVRQPDGMEVVFLRLNT